MNTARRYLLRIGLALAVIGWGDMRRAELDSSKGMYTGPPIKERHLRGTVIMAFGGLLFGLGLPRITKDESESALVNDER